MQLSKIQVEVLQTLNEENDWIRFLDVDSRKDLYPLVDAKLISRLAFTSASDVGYRITDRGRQRLAEIEEDAMGGVYAEDPSIAVEKAEKAEKLFEFWWKMFGKSTFEKELDIKVMRKEVMSHAFVAGYLAGYDKIGTL